MRTSLRLSSLVTLAALTASVGHAEDRRSKPRPSRPTPPPADDDASAAKPRRDRDRPAPVPEGTSDPAEARRDRMREPRGHTSDPRVTVTVAADAPAPPTVGLKKTQPPEYNKLPARDEIRKLEDTIYSMEKPRATLWNWRDDPQGGDMRDIEFVAKQLAELDEKVQAVVAKQPDWKRLPEYRERIAHLTKAHAAQRAQYQAAQAARADAAAAAEAAATAAWQAKRATDDGVRGAVHTASAGKVVFASAAITDATTPGQLITSAGATAPLHVRAYLKESPWNAMHTDGVDCGRIEVDDYAIVTRVAIGGADSIVLERRRLDLATFKARTVLELTTGSLTTGGTFGNADEAKAQFGWITKVGSDLKPGRNDVTLSVWVTCPAGQQGVEVARGTIAIDATAAALTELSGRGRFKMAPSAHPAKALAKLRDKLSKRYAADYDLIDLRSAGEWQPTRNEYGVVLAREMPLVVVVRRRGTNACTLWSVMMSEPFDGRNYGPALNIANEFPRPFVCNPI